MRRTPMQSRGLAGRRALAAETDERLVALAVGGDQAAFEGIVERYRGPLLRYCLGYLPAAAAEDALQQTFVSAYSVLMRGQGRPPVALKPWLYRIAHNAALNVARDSHQFAALPEDLDGVERPEEVAQRNERLARVVRAVSALPSRQRQVIVRHALDGESHEEIASDLGLSPGAIRQLAHRARQTVRRAAAGVLPLPVLRWLALEPAAAESAAATGGGAAVKVALAVAVVAVGGGAVEVSTRLPQDHRHAVVTERAPRPADGPAGGAGSQPAVRLVGPLSGAAAGSGDSSLMVSGDTSRSGSSGSDDGGSGRGSGTSGGSSGSSGDDGSDASSDSGSGSSGGDGSGSSGSGGSGLSTGSGSGSSGSDTSGSSGSGSGGSGSSDTSGSGSSDGSGSGSSGGSGSGSSGTSGSGSSGTSGSDTSGSGGTGASSGDSGDATLLEQASTTTPIATEDGTSSGSGSSGSSGDSGSSGSGSSGSGG